MKDPRPLGLSPKRARRAAELSLVWSLCLGMSFPAPAWVYAEPTYQDKGIVRSANPAAEADLARKEFLNTKILRGEDDPVKEYLFDSGTKQLTEMGQLMFNMLSQAQGAQRQGELKELTQRLDAMVVNLRSAGAYTPAKKAEVERGLKDLKKRYGGLLDAVTKDTESTDLFSAHLRLNTMFDAMSQREEKALGPGDVRMHQTESGIYYYDRDGKLLYKTNKNRVIIFNQQLLDQQKAINSRLSQNGTFGMPPDCPKRIRESGRFQHDLMLYSWCDQKVRVDAIGELKRRQRVILMAALVGHQLGSEINNKDKLIALEKQLEKEQITSGSWVPGFAAEYGRKFGVFDDSSFPMAGDLINDKFTKYNGYLVQLNDALAVYRDRIDAYQGADTITNDQLKQLKAQERLVSRFMALTQMEALRVQTEFMMETLSYEVEKGADGKERLRRVELSPDSINYVRAVRTAGLSGPQQKKMFEQWHAMANRFYRLSRGYDNIEEQLNASDINSDLKKPNIALMAAEADLQVLQRDYSNLMQMPQLLKFTKDQTDGSWWHWTAPVTRFAFEAANAISGGEKGLDWGGQYVRARGEIDKMAPKVEGVVTLLADGRYRDAAMAVVTADEGALATHLRLSVGTRYDDIKLTDKAAAVLAKYQENLGHVQTVHNYSSIPIDIVKWSVFLGVGSKAAGWASRGVYQTIAGRSLAAGAEVGAFRRGTAEIFKHMAIRFETLGPEFQTNIFKDTAYRFANSMARITAFAGMIAPIGGSVTTIQHLASGEKSQFSGAGDAFFQGSVSTAKWAAENPFILFVNIPYTAFSGTRAQGVAESLANRGLVGNVWAGGWKSAQGAVNLGGRAKAFLSGQTFTKATFADRVLARTALNGPGATKWLENLAERGMAGKAASTSLGFLRAGITNIDHVGKFWAFGQTAGYVGHHLSYNLRSLRINDGPGLGVDGKPIPEEQQSWVYRNVTDRLVPRYEANENRRIKRALQDQLHWSESYVWMLLPMHPAQASETQDAIQNKIGNDQFIKSKDTAALLEMANANPQGVEGAQPLKMLYFEKAPLFQRVMTYRFGRRLQANEFYASRESIEEATKRLLRDEVKEKTGQDPHQQPWKYLEMLGIEDGQMLGRLRMREYTRNALTEQAELAFRDHPNLAKRIIDAKPSSVVEGVGTLSRPLLEEVALVVRHAGKVGGSKNPFTTAEYKGTVAKAETILEPYFKSRGPRDAAATELKAHLDKLGPRSEPLQRYLDNFLETVQEWGARAKAKSANLEHYTELLNRAENEISQTKGLSKGEADAVKSAIKYLRAVETRFNYFNNGEYFMARSGEAFDVAVNKAGSTSNATRLKAEIAKMKETVTAFMREKGMVEGQGNLTAMGKDRGAAVSENPGGDKFSAMVKELDGRVKTLANDPSISRSDAALLGELVKNIEGAPWLLRNSKGFNLQGWRPVQFESLAWFMRALLEGNSTGNTLRIFLKLKTGGGKTLVATEGMWSFIEADAKAQGRKPVLLTPQENLVQQMEAELKATRNYGDIKVTTWSKLNAELAQRKVGSSGDKDATIKANSTEELYIVSDEYDAPFLAPATTIGQQLATISRVNEGLNILRRTGDRMSELINDPQTNLRTQLEYYTKTMRMHSLELADHPGYAKLADGVAKLERAVRELHKLQTQSGKPTAGRAEAIKTQVEAIRQLVDGRPVPGVGKQGGLTQMVEGMKIENPWGKGRKVLESGVESIRTQANQLLEIKDPASAAKSLGRGGKVNEAIKAIEKMIAAESNGIVGRSPSAIELGSKTSSFRSRLESLVDRVSGQNKTLLEAAKTLETRSAEVESLRSKLKGMEAGAQARRAVETDLQRAEIELRSTVQAVDKIVSVDAQKPLVEFASGDAVESGHLSVSARRLRLRLGELTAEVSPGKSKVGEITNLITEHARRQGSTLQSAASREVLSLADGQSRIIHSRPPEAAHSLRRVADLGRNVLETLEKPSEFVPSKGKKVGLLDRLRGRDALRSEVDQLLGQQEQAVHYSRLNTGKQMKELLEVASKLRSIEAGPKASQVEALASQIRDLNLQKQILLKDGRSTTAIDRQISSLTAQKTKLSRTPLADEVQAMAERLGKDASAAEAAKVDALLETFKTRVARGSAAESLLARVEIVQNGLRVRDVLSENTRRIRHEMDMRQEGWRDRVRELVAERNGMFEQTVSKRNAVYEVYERMMQAMASDRYGFLSHQSSPLAELLHQKKVIEAPEVAAKTMRRQAASLVSKLREVEGHYRRMQAEAEGQLKTLKTKNAPASQIELAEARVKEAKLQFAEAADALAEAKFNYRTTRTIADRLNGLIDYAPEGKGPNAEALKTQRAELFRLVEELTAKNSKLGELKAKRVDSKSPEAKQIETLEFEAKQMQSRLEGLHKQVSQMNREVATEALEQKLSEAETAEARAEFKVKAAKSPEMLQLARRELTLARFEKGVAKGLVELQVSGVKKAPMEFQALKQTRDAAWARRQRINETLQQEKAKPEGSRSEEKIRTASEQIEWLDAQMLEIGKQLYQFQKKLAPGVLELAQNHAGSSASKWRSKLDPLIGESVEGGVPTELARLRNLRSELMQQRGELAGKHAVVDAELVIEAEFAKNGSPLSKLSAEARRSMRSLAESADGLKAEGLPKTVREAASRFEKAAGESAKTLESGSGGYERTNGLTRARAEAGRLTSELRRALENQNLPKSQRALLETKAQALERGGEKVKTAQESLAARLETVREASRPKETISPTEALDLQLAEINKGIRALEGLREPVRSMGGRYDPASPGSAQQHPALEVQRRALENDPAKAKAAYERKLKKLAGRFTAELNDAFAAEPFLAPEVSAQMFWNINGMYAWAKGIPVIGKYLFRGRPSPWVQRELVNMATGHHNEVSDVRFDGQTKKVVPIHLGEWMPTMDIGTRRFWELHFKTGLTMPYEHQALVNMRNFVTDSPKLPIIGFSGTVGKVLLSQLQAKSGGFRVVGTGSAGFPNVGMQVVPSATARFQLIANSLVESIENPGTKRITVVNHANSKDLKQMRRYLLRTGLVSEGEITMIFSDAVALGETMPQANVRKTMNLGALDTGRARIVLMDTRVAGRGLDLNWKGGGYRKVDVYFMDPHKISQVHEVQAGGRVDLDRLLPGAERTFTRVIDIASAKNDPAFQEAMLFHPQFRSIYYELMNNPPPSLRQSMSMRGVGTADWQARHDWIMSLPKDNPIRLSYFNLFTDYVRNSQLEEEVSQLKSSRFLEGPNMNIPAHAPALHWAPKLSR
ncbi:MAG: hypothetical protein CO113_17205 [Elusimicrobia bacterium CG_4_9_14_3_um_filter_62_55]|nr:MAG: hypothetical protein COX66_09570 [Elusimicrobia bacterium CG_4_10_14_0_2_um_filter_63_34]PJB23687.1 MAG: hypothetical protein CO113_17205 [Elusimicrobia bacterium CG_4_9_14_3_um_filter_62_55]